MNKVWKSYSSIYNSYNLDHSPWLVQASIWNRVQCCFQCSDLSISHQDTLEIHGRTLKTHCLINTKNAWPLIGHAKYGGMARHVVRASSVGVT
jgi:hypothetical protein